MSKNLPRILTVCLTIIVLLSSCRKKEFDEFYGRPETLADPIYQQLQVKGNFSKFLECVDKAGYKETLSAAGSWTVFAPTDEAFAIYLKDNNLSEINADLASAIVRYSMTYDGEKIERLSDNLTARGFVKNAGFRRRTVYYDFVYDGTDNNGKPIKVIAANRNGSYLPTDFNNKNLPYFLAPFMSFTGIGAVDYNYFYPSSEFTGKNVGPARITQEDIVAENGVIHIIDRVLTPPQSIDQYIGAKSQYSAFKSLLDKYVTYNLNADISRRYQVLTGKTDNVYAKNYSALLGFSPNNENYLKDDANDAQIGMYTLFAPTDAAVEAYAKVLLKYYAKSRLQPGDYKAQLSELYALRPDIIRDFVNSHFYRTAVWPGKFNSVNSFLGEVTKLNPGNVVDKQFLSNGLFYGVNEAQNANSFATVYGKVNLDPTFYIMKQAMDVLGYTIPIKTASLKYVIVPIPDATLVSLGFSYDPFFPSAPIRGDLTILRRLLQTHIIPLGDRAVPNFATGSGILEASNGEYIKYDKGFIFSAGTQDLAAASDKTIKIDSIVNAVNGADVYATRVLAYTSLPVSKHIERYALTTTDPYYSFFQYLKNNVTLYNATSGAIQGITDGSFYSIFIPTNTAIQAAVTAGLLPKLANGSPNYTPTDASDISKVSKFIQYHIIKNSVASDGQKTGSFETLLKDESGDAAKVTVTTNTTNSLILRDVTNTSVNVLLGAADRSNVLSNRTVIHQINSYLKYQF
ncbi:fasciclin domain-containing protein [Pedobacter rhizosphaerae]|uniref:Fasciclin domain-containing protein n=1 Tax=Pedobacter rhizosphaerae TaxID=390241 RepID=A0A1H9QLH3_9SPHI|nr:fasciclin domain-containing protein [Pedobacter rhizosphaerae]SER60603.1 Fasciclin domain-containing protein [Pedobacter rhizosphaerae]